MALEDENQSSSINKLQIEGKIKLLTARKETLFQRVQNALDQSKFKNDNTPGDEKIKQSFIIRCMSLEETKKEFNQTVEDINICKIELGEKPNFSELNGFDSMYCAVQKKLSELNKTGKISSDNLPSHTTSTVPAITRPSLPPLEIPHFDGNELNWPFFYRSFKSIVVDNPQLTDDDRMRFLSGCLKNKALALISGIVPIGENFVSVWSTLCSRYADPRVLANKYLDTIFKYQPVQRETATSIDHFLQNFISPAQAFLNLNIKDPINFILYYLAAARLPAPTVRQFELSISSQNHTGEQEQNELPGFKELDSFLQNYVKILTHSSGPSLNVSSTLRRGRFPNSPQPNLPAFKSTSFNNSPYTNVTHRNSKPFLPHSFIAKEEPTTSYVKSAITKCPICLTAEHHPYMCDLFKNMSLKERLTAVEKHNLCNNCLSYRHRTRWCQSRRFCFKCNLKHHSLLCESTTDTSFPKKPQENMNISAVASSTSVFASSAPITVLLSTALVNIFDTSGKPHRCRALLDSASQSNFITQSLCSKLGLTLQPVMTNIQGIGARMCSIKNQSTFKFASRIDKNSEYKITALVIDQITDKLPSFPIPLNNLEYLKALPLADETYHEPGDIDLLIGASLFADLLGPGKVTGPPNSPLALQTSLGYIIMGPVNLPLPSASLNEYSCQSYCNMVAEPLDKLVARMWEHDDITSSEKISSDEEECERIFSKTTLRLPDGRFSVDLPFYKEPSLLGNSKEIVLRRFYSLENRLNSNPNLRLEYNKFMQDYIDQGHMILGEEDSNGCYLPHHCVFKPDSTTTKVRVVWDASCLTSSGYSLNDVLHTGPKLHADLNSILLKFRLFAVAITADIRQMYRQIYINKPHQNYQKIFWRFSNEEPLKVYTLTTVTFGVKPAPYLALKVLQTLAEDSKDLYPIAASTVKNEFFVDDLACSFPTVNKALEAHQQLVTSLKGGGFDLVKWNSNSKNFLNSINSDIRLNQTIEFDSTAPMKILGLQYNSLNDYFMFIVKITDKTCSKRNILSTFARIFDPLGFLAPVTVSLKILIKECWNLGLAWDDQVPSCNALTSTWNQLISQLPLLSNYFIPRHIGFNINYQIDLIGFADASSKAYGAVIYSRVKIKDQYFLSLLSAKTRVAPQKSTSIPRLELCAAVLLARLFNFVINSFSIKIKINNLFAFSDSSCVISWLSSPPARWKVYVANRVNQINTLVPDACWLHIPGTSNPADCLSRGISPKILLNHPLWLSGPAWLAQERSEWPQSFAPPGGEDILEEKVVVNTTCLKQEDNPLNLLIHRCSSYDGILRIISYCNRWKDRVSRKLSYITASELEKAEIIILNYIQNLNFKNEINLLICQKITSPNFRKLNPFINKNGLLAVGGRLTNADLDYHKKHPILLPKDNRLIELLVDNYHVRYFHTGVATTLALLRQKYWILGGRALVRKRISACNKCFRIRPQPSYPLMGNLPKERVTECKPFLHTGVDYAGPYHIVFSRRRGVRTHKAYLALFVCLSTKAVHLELATDLSTDTFLNALKRFISRRGPVSKFYSDGGTNFMGAKNHLNEVYELLTSSTYKSAFGQELSSHRITWVQQVPSAPHMGGIWEANIKSAKSHLNKIIGDRVLTYEELNTFLTQVEALLNSRPLCVLSSDPNDPTALTPAHFLTGHPLGHFPSPLLEDISTNRLTRYQLLEQMSTHFWRRWHIEYLHTLQTREKWNTPSKPIAVGTIVLIRQDNTAPLNWPLGIIEKIHPGQDGVIRVATVRSKGNLYRRPVIKLCPLPSQ